MSWGPIQLRQRSTRKVVFTGEASPAPGGGAMPQPNDIPNLALWLDAADAATLNSGSPADDDPVSLWADRSSNGWDATQAVADNQPTYKTAIQNGLGVVRFSEDAAEVAYLDVLAGLGIFRDKAECTIFAVANYMGQRADARPFVATYAADPTAWRVSFGEAGFSVDVIEDGNVVVASFPDFSTFDATVVQTFLISAGWSDWGLSGSGMSDYPGAICDTPATQFSRLPVANTPDSDSAVVRVGYAFLQTPGLFLDLGELLVYQRMLNVTERRQVVEYLASKWAIL